MIPGASLDQIDTWDYAGTNKAGDMAWKSTGQPGVRYREHPTRKHFGQPDRYYAIRTYASGKSREEGLGWASEGWTAKKAAALLAELRQAQVTGAGAQTLAERRAQVQEQQREAERASKADQAAAISLADFFEKHYLPLAKKNKSSWRTDEIRINKTINPGLGHMPLRSITQADVKKFLEGLAKAGAAQATVNHHHAILRQAYNIAATTSMDGVVLFEGQSPTSGIKAANPFNARDRFLFYDEADKLIDGASRKSVDLHDAIVIALNTGLRLGEIQRMTWLDVDLRHDFLTVRDGPNRKPGGKVPLNPDAKAALKARLARRTSESPRVFPGVIGEERSFRSEFERLVDALGFNKGVTDRRQLVVFHTLRHTFASWLALAGTDIYRIKKLMRHKTLKMTERYAHLIPDATKAAVHNLRPPKGS